MKTPNPPPSWTRADPTGAPMVLRAGDEEIATAAARADLLSRVRAGNFAGPLDVEIVSFVQRVTPNRNFSRFGVGTLRKGALSFRGQVVLVDHSQREQAARIGTIKSSAAERGEDGSISFRKVLSIVKPHAMESVLDGTIDRFSIGWYPTGPINCTVCKTPMWGRASTCPHWPGDVVEGKPVEMVYTAWEGVEVSAVNVPAVIGTGIEEIRAALAADREDRDRNRGGEPPRRNATMDLELLRKTLGLPATATEGEIMAALTALNGRVAEAEAARVAAGALALNALITAAYADGRIPIARDAAGAQIPSELEKQLRALPVASAEAMLGALPRNHPNGPGGPQGGANPAPAPADPRLADGTTNPHLQGMLDQVGLTLDDVKAYGPQHRARVNRSKIPAPPNLFRLFKTRFIGDPGAAR